MPEHIEQNKSASSGVVYVGRIPHGFYENEMRAYFSQFGDIIRLRLSRSRKTGRSKHYAFIEFASAEVARIVAESMDNYLMFGHILKCKTVRQEQLHEDVWKGANKRFKKIPRNKIEGRKLMASAGLGSWNKRIATERKRREGRAEKLKAIGYEFNTPELKAADDAKRTKDSGLIDGRPETKLIENDAPLEEKKTPSPAPVTEDAVQKKPKADKKSKVSLEDPAAIAKAHKKSSRNSSSEKDSVKRKRSSVTEKEGSSKKIGGSAEKKAKRMKKSSK